MSIERRSTFMVHLLRSRWKNAGIMCEVTCVLLQLLKNLTYLSSDKYSPSIGKEEINY